LQNPSRMEAKALPLSHFRARAGSPLLLSAEASSAARKGSGAPGRSRASRYDAGAPPSRAGRGGVWKRDDPEDSPRRTGMTGVPKLNPKFSTKRAGTSKVPIINFEVSHHRAVAAVRLLRADKGKAFVDLLNEKANDSGENEMGYVERTLGFSTRHLDDRDIRLVTVIVAGTVRWKRYIDYLIMSLCSEEKVFSNMEPLLLQRYCELASLKFSNLMYQLMLSLMRM
uniref:NusB/RsmB/TIM44 domain-containing protein n=1 Tax=Aegilops tauschii subsp. strangulata TaxID=200361 RepID=A0A453L249_AEGTS